MTWEHGRVGNGNLAAPGVGRGQMPGRFGAEPHLPGQRAKGKHQQSSGRPQPVRCSSAPLGIALLTRLGGFVFFALMWPGD